jgi:hypothetical protein
MIKNKTLGKYKRESVTMSLSYFRKVYKKVGERQWEDFEIAPGHIYRVCFKSDLVEIIRRFLNRRATIGELRRELQGK